MDEQREPARGIIGAMSAALDARNDSIQESYDQRSEYLSKVALHRYQCARGCQIATVFRADGVVLCAVRGYKVSPGKNQTISTQAGRDRNMVDGGWPPHVYDVQHLHGPIEESNATITMACRHYLGSVRTQSILDVIRNVRPGHPGKPTRLE